MATASSTSSGRYVRLEDVFQDEIIHKFADISEFKKFARSQNGLCLRESDVQSAIDDNSKSADQKLEMLNKWVLKNGKDATVSRIRYHVERYKIGDNPKDMGRKVDAISDNLQKLSVQNTTPQRKDLVQKKKTQPKTTSAKANALIMFGMNNRQMYSFKLTSKKLGRMQEYPYGYNFTALLLNQNIYIMECGEVSRLNYSDPAAKWSVVAIMAQNENSYPSAATFRGSIYACGSSGESSKCVERYDEREGAWISSPFMNVARHNPHVAASDDHIYCVGGGDKKYIRQKNGERFDGTKWEFIKQLPRVTMGTNAVVFEEKLYISDDKGVLCYNIQTDSWRELKSSLPFHFYTTSIRVVNDKLYIIGFTQKENNALYLLDPKAEKLTWVHSFDIEFKPRQCVAVHL